MSLSGKRKVDCEKRLFINEWCNKYFAIQHNKNVICPIFQNTITVMKEYNIEHYYCTKCAAKFANIEGQLQFDEMKQFKKSLNMHEIFNANEKTLSL